MSVPTSLRFATRAMAACNDGAPTSSSPAPSQAWRRWLMGIAGLVVLACTDNFLPPPAVRLAFTTQPSDAPAGVAIDPVAVAIEDASGDLVPSATNVVTVAIETNPGGSTLTGTTSVAAVHGVATFSNLHLDKPGTGYTLTAAATGLTGATSGPFTIAPAPTTGSLRISATTSGSLPDPDGYVVCIDPTGGGWDEEISCGYGGSSAVAVNGTVTVTVDTGDHTVLLMGVAANCTVAGDNPRGVHAPGGQTAAVPFAVTCAAATLHVTTTTTGASIDPDGYRLCIDPVPDWDGGYSCTTEHAVGVNSGVSMLVGIGIHVVLLEDVAANCTVGDNPRTVDVAGATQVAFVITCVAARLWASPM